MVFFSDVEMTISGPGEDYLLRKMGGKENMGLGRYQARLGLCGHFFFLIGDPYQVRGKGL